MNRKSRRAAGKQAGFITAGSGSIKNKGSSYLFPLALRHFQNRQLTDAESICQKVLAREPNHANTLHLLGIIAYQTGRQQMAADSIGKAIALNPRIPTFHYNMGSALQTLGRLEEAVAHCTQAATLQPDWAAAHALLGNAFFSQGNLAEAADKYQQALDIEPDFVEVIYRLGNVLQLQGRLEEAKARYQQALVLRPNFPEAHNNLGNALRQQGKLDEAVAHCRRSLALKADNPEALNNLALSLQQKGATEEALKCYRQALALRPNFLEAHQNLCLALMSIGSMEQALDHALRALEMKESSDTKAIVVQCMRSFTDLTSLPEIGDLRRQVIRALVEPWGRPGDLASVAAGLVKSDSEIKECIEGARSSARFVIGPRHLAAACKNELLRCLLKSTPVSDWDLEKFLIGIRTAVLDLALTDTASSYHENNLLSFCCALARQCFVNEYIFACSETELRRARHLRDALITALQSGSPFPTLWLVAIAAYFPLHSLPVANLLLKMTFAEAVAKLIAQQVLEPQQERIYRTSFPRLTKIEDEVSKLVQQQYEESPYPRWVRTAPMGAPTTIGRFLGRMFPMASLTCFDEKAGTEILIAGCGTGLQSIDTAQRLPGARLLAIDLSLTSLAYASRKTRELGLNNIEYAQADILQLGDIGRTFDVIESTGVLHHLADPMAGWRTLLSLLRPGGFMGLGLYSKLARKNIIGAAQAFVSQHGYTASDIRRCRQELAEFHDDAIFKNLTRIGDFYSTSGCRDLLFNVQEHLLTLPELDRFLTENDLRFLGFVVENRILLQFRQRFPWIEAEADLNLWHTFEVENPTTFIRMYQFWLQKKDRD